MDRETYLEQTAATRAERLRWWQEARFGMFIHWGLYAQLGRHEWVMNRERIPVESYEKLADTWKPKERPAREWARLVLQGLSESNPDEIAGVTVIKLACDAPPQQVLGPGCVVLSH